MNKLSEFIKFFFGIPISVIALFFIGKLIISNWQKSALQLHSINGLFICISIFCFLLYFFARAFLWKKILENKGHYFTIKETCYIWATSELKRYIPGNVWSFITRFILYGERQVEKKVLLSALIDEAKSIVAGSAILSVFSLPFVLSLFSPIHQYRNLLLAISYPALAVGAIIYLREQKNGINLLSVSILSYILFGIGTYFSILSFTYISLPSLLLLIPFFSFCYLVGYLSFITPMGLGVREGALTIGLTHFISQGLAAFSAIFSRIILIISELIFLGISLLWFKTENKTIIKIGEFVKKNKIELTLTFFILVYILYFATASILRYDNFYTGRFDLGNMDQTVWNTLHGRIFQLTDPDGTQIISRLSVHADFLLIFLAPFYIVWSDPRMLLLIQTVILAAGAIFVFLIAKKVFKQKSLPLIFALLYLFNPSVEFTNLYDFHAVVLATTFILAAFYFFLENKYLPFIIFAILAGLTKENIWLIIAFFGLFMIVRKKILPGIIWIALCTAIFYFLVWHAIPTARGRQHFALSYYSDFGDNPGSIVKNILLSPQKTITTVLKPDRTSYIVGIFSPLGFLSFLSPLYLIFAAPEFVITLLSNNIQLRQIYYQYTATITPFIFISAVYGANFLKQKFAGLSDYIPYYLIILGVISSYFFGPLPGAKKENLDMFTKPLTNKMLIADYLEDINKNYSVAATNNLGSHLSRRQNVYTIPLGIDHADVVVFLLNDNYAQPSLAAQKKMANKLKKDPNYKFLLENGDFVSFQKVSVQ